MRLKLLLPDVKTTEFSQPKKCPRAGCTGMRFYPRQIVQKKIVDTQYKEVSAWRYQCAKCGCTFRIYPKGVNHKQTSFRGHLFHAAPLPRQTYLCLLRLAHAVCRAC
jgi:hypothetical protein